MTDGPVRPIRTRNHGPIAPDRMPEAGWRRFFRDPISTLAVTGGGDLNPGPPGMYLLKKVIQLREKSHPDHEKPFLEHLEDLRVMITRIVLTLLISMIVCFSFQEQLMEVLRRPVEQVWINQLDAKLPKKKDGVDKPLDVETWEKAKALEHAATALEPEQRAVFHQSHPEPDLVFHARSVGLLRAALALPEEARDGFLNRLGLEDSLRKQVKVLVKTAPSPEMDSRGNLKLMSALKPTETFMLSMKLSFFAGIILAFPLLLMYVLQFVLPGLHKHEKKVMWPAMAVGFGLFLGGVLFAYYGVLPRALMFFYEWSGSLGVSNDWRIGEYISFATQFTLLFGLSFELPVVVMVLVKLGLLTYETMSNTRSYAILAIFVTAAVLTPTPDVLTLLLMALPMILLYEICIWLAWFDRRRNRIDEQREAREREESLARTAVAGTAATGDYPTDPWHDDPHHEDHHHDDHHHHEAGDHGWTPDCEPAVPTDEPEVSDIPPDRGPEESKSDDIVESDDGGKGTQ
jgi:sec-independent protein translocase protein TatC